MKRCLGPGLAAPSLCALALGAWLAGGPQARAQPAPVVRNPAASPAQGAAGGQGGSPAQAAQPARPAAPDNAVTPATPAPPTKSAPPTTRTAVVRAAPAAPSGQPDDDNADDAPDDAPETVPAAPAKSGARTYTVRRGESLSILSQRLTGDRMGWPKLWALNPDIPNPNRIRPGQVIRVSGPPGEGPGKQEKIAPAAEPATEATRQRSSSHALVATHMTSRPAPPRPAGPRLRQLGFVDEGALQAAGTINGSPEEKIMLASGDQAYLQFPPGQAARPSAHYSVYQVDVQRPVREPGSALVIGYLVRVCGEVVIDDDGADRGVSTGHLVNLAEPVERGYRVGPLLPDMRQVAPKKSEVSLSGRVIAAVDPGSMISAQTFVIVNRGRRHGVEPGNRFLVTRQGDGLKRMLESWDTMDPNFPPHTIAEILAVDVRDETSVGWVSRAERELRVGDVADLQQGY